MPCCSTKKSKPEAKESCCQTSAEEKTAKTPDQAKSGCGCGGGKESAPKKEEQKTTSCC